MLIELILLKTCYVLGKTLKGICGVRLDNRNVLRAQGHMTKFFKRFLSFN